MQQRARIDQLIRVLGNPADLADLSLAQWDALLPVARRLHMLGRFWPQLQRLELTASVPSRVAPHLQSAALMVDQHRGRVNWEVNRIERVLTPLPGPVVLLKGAAYITAGLRCAEGRLSSDVDVLLPRAQLSLAEQTLLANNWLSMVDDAYDQHYYRAWAHELPPMRHMLRGTLIDVHHTIVPPTSRLTPDPASLIDASLPVGSSGQLRILCPPDMVLHSAVHAFFDGDFSQVLRDLLDLHELLSEFSGDPTFWPQLRHRADHLGLQRPLYYALRLCKRYFATDIDSGVVPSGPSLPVRTLMDTLAERAIYAPSSGSAAHWLLYMRAHWLRMPPWLLTRHLLRKSLRRLAPAE